MVIPSVSLKGKLTQSSQLLIETWDTKPVKNPIRKDWGVEDCGK